MWDFAPHPAGDARAPGVTLVGDLIEGEFSLRETYVANIVTSAVALSFLLVPGGKVELARIIAVAYGQATSAEILDQGLQMITGRIEYFNSEYLLNELFVRGTINLIALITAGRLIPRGSGRPPKYFKTWMEGKIGGNLIWKQGELSSGINLIGEGIIDVLRDIKNLIEEIFNHGFIKSVDCDKRD